MHANKVCHRDMKLENILMSQRGRASLIKITDFGLSKLLNDNSFMCSYVGTPAYVAPEVLKNSFVLSSRSNCRESVYTFKADMWSLGECLPTFRPATSVQSPS